MKKSGIIAFICLALAACSNSVNTEQTEQKMRDSMDAAQRIKDSLAVEAKILQDMETADTMKPALEAAPEIKK